MCVCVMSGVSTAGVCVAAGWVRSRAGHTNNIRAPHTPPHAVPQLKLNTAAKANPGMCWSGGAEEEGGRKGKKSDPSDGSNKIMIKLVMVERHRGVHDEKRV